MLASLSIILLIISYLYYEKLSLFNNKYKILENKVDSLEKVVNSNLTHRRDTLIIDVRPQTIKIYQPNGNSINNNSSIASTPR